MTFFLILVFIFLLVFVSDNNLSHNMSFINLKMFQLCEQRYTYQRVGSFPTWWTLHNNDNIALSEQTRSRGDILQVHQIYFVHLSERDWRGGRGVHDPSVCQRVQRTSHDEQSLARNETFWETGPPRNTQAEIRKNWIDSSGPDLPEGASDPSYSQYKKNA